MNNGRYVLMIAVLSCALMFVAFAENDAEKQQPKDDKAKAQAQDGKANNSATNKMAAPATVKAESPEPSLPGVLSEKEEDKLVSFYSDESAKMDYSFICTIINGVLSEEEKAKYKDSKKMPFKVYCKMEALKAKAKNRDTITTGSVYLYLRDSKGRVVFNKVLPIKDIAPLGSGKGGYTGEMEQEGVYKMVVWYKYKNMTFGKTARFKMAIPKNK